MDSLKGITRVVSLTLVACMMSACAYVQVRDQTTSPAHYVFDGDNSGYDVKAKVNLGPGVIDSGLQTNIVTVHGISIPITMIKSGVNPEFDYSGRWRLTATSWFTECGFSVRHVAQGRFWGVIPLKDSSIKQIGGDPSRQSLMLYGSDWSRAVVHLSAGTALVETVPIMTENGIGLTNSYSAPITINSITFLCDGSDCGSRTDPPITNIIVPGFPVTLNCGHMKFVHFSCTQKAINHSVGGKVKFGTDRGIVRATFTCFPDRGA